MEETTESNVVKGIKTLSVWAQKGEQSGLPVGCLSAGDELVTQPELCMRGGAISRGGESLSHHRVWKRHPGFFVMLSQRYLWDHIKKEGLH